MNKRCPNCNSENIIDIIYGYPTDELLEDSKAGRVVLGGCIVEPSNPIFKCNNCFKRFGELGELGL